MSTQNTEWNIKRKTLNAEVKMVKQNVQTYTAVEQRQHHEKWCTSIIQGKYMKTTSHLEKKKEGRNTIKMI